MKIRFITTLILLVVTGSFLYINGQHSHKIVPPESADLFFRSQPLANEQSNKQETHYLFDLIDHEPEQIKQLLERAKSLSRTVNTSNGKSRIAMVIHGPDIEIFDVKNYIKNKDIIDLAAQLDAADIIDFKVCQVTADARGINKSNFPSFMEVVPFAPDEIDRLENEGYVEL